MREGGDGCGGERTVKAGIERRLPASARLTPRDTSLTHNRTSSRAQMPRRRRASQTRSRAGGNARHVLGARKPRPVTHACALSFDRFLLPPITCSYQFLCLPPSFSSASSRRRWPGQNTTMAMSKIAKRRSRCSWVHNRWLGRDYLRRLHCRYPPERRTKPVSATIILYTAMRTYP